MYSPLRNIMAFPNINNRRFVDLSYDSDDDNVDTAVLEFDQFLNRSFENDVAGVPKGSFPILLSPVREPTCSEDEAVLECPICLEQRPKFQFHLFACGHGVCKMNDFCQKYDFEHCAICKKARNVEEEVTKFSLSEEEERLKNEKLFEDELQRAIEMSKLSEKAGEDLSSNNTVQRKEEESFEEHLKQAMLLSLQTGIHSNEEEDEGYLSSDSTITEYNEDKKEEHDEGYDSETTIASTVTLDEQASIATMTEWTVLNPRKKQRRH